MAENDGKVIPLCPQSQAPNLPPIRGITQGSTPVLTRLEEATANERPRG
jgi:hypothetical protein